MIQQNLSQEQIAEFVLAAHHDIEKVQTMHQQNPSLLNACYTKFNENALQAAGHMGERDIAKYLLNAGAPMTIFAAAMLGETALVRELLQQNPHIANAKGVHQISLFYHAALSGKTEIIQLIYDSGGNIDDAALHAAVKFGYLEMVVWLLEHNVQQINILNFEQKTPLRVASERGFHDIVDLLKHHGGTA